MKKLFKSLIRKLIIWLFVGNDFSKLYGRVWSPVRASKPVTFLFLLISLEYYKFNYGILSILSILLLTSLLMPWYIRKSMNVKFSELSKVQKYSLGFTMDLNKKESDEYEGYYDYYNYKTPRHYNFWGFMSTIFFVSFLLVNLYYNI